MDLFIDGTSGIPIYVQLKNQIKYRITGGTLAAAEQLPTVRQLAVDLSINPNTVARVYLELEREGLIVTQQGRGTFVADPAPTDQFDMQRQVKLKEAIIHALIEGLHLGFPLEDVEREFLGVLEAWRKTQSPEGSASVPTGPRRPPVTSQG